MQKFHEQKGGRDNESERIAAVTFEASTFVTYQVNAVSYNGFKPTEVLLDNQADISVMRPISYESWSQRRIK